MPRTKPYISFIGNESYAEYTVITWSDKSSDPYSNGTELGTYRTATVAIDSDFFCATAITFEVLKQISLSSSSFSTCILNLYFSRLYG